MKPWMYWLILVIEVICCFWMDPISQNLEYHNFADKRGLLGIQNFGDVLSNIPFLLVGYLGLKHMKQHYQNVPAASSWTMVFLGILLVCPGSMFYHLNPNNFTLIWDRLPMTIGFMAITTALLAHKSSRKTEHLILFSLIIIGLLSIWYWASFDDLRPYFMVQLTPIILVPLFAFTESSMKSIRHFLLGAFIFYFLAKVTEKYDSHIFDVFILSGHTLKHLLAGVAVWCFYRICKKLTRA